MSTASSDDDRYDGAMASELYSNFYKYKKECVIRRIVRRGMRMKYRSQHQILTQLKVQAAVREELQKQEEEDGAKIRGLHSTGPIDFVQIGLELEEAQCKLRALAKEQASKAKALRSSSLKDQRIHLTKATKEWELIRAIYMPGLLQYQLESGVGGPGAWDGDPNPEDVRLFLPSQLPSDNRPVVCVDGLSEIEARFRDAQCHDALEALRCTLQIKARMIQFKNKNIRGQTQSTRSWALIDRVHRQALASVDKYRRARAAKLELCGPGLWEQSLQPLRNNNVRGYSDPQRRPKGPGRRGIWEDENPPTDVAGDDATPHDIDAIKAVPSERSRREGMGRTTHEISWIWLGNSVHKELDGREGEDIVRAEWARSRARVRRCKEEVQLLLEEMRCVLAYLEWRENWWLSQAKLRPTVSPELAEGLSSYAEGQAAIQANLSTSFIQAWHTPLGMINEEEMNEEEEADASNAAEIDGWNVEEDDNDEEDERDIFS